MLIGHQKQLDFLRNSFKTEKASHAYLFSGPTKLGKKTLALFLLSEIFGKDKHPDITLVEPSDGEIKISQIRDLIWKLSLKPHSAFAKAAVIDNAHLMNTEAQNSLLKTLEEPKGSTFLFLVTDRPEILLPTIRSRAQIIKFYPVEKEQIYKFLKEKGIAEETAESIFQISSGRPGVAVDFVSDSSGMEFFQNALRDIEKISESDLCFRFQYAKSVAEDVRLLENNLDIWERYFRNKLIMSAKDGGSQGKYSLLKLKNIINGIQNAKSLIFGTNANPRLALESLMLNF